MPCDDLFVRFSPFSLINSPVITTHVFQEVEVGVGLVVVERGVASHPVTFPCPVNLDVTNSSVNITKRGVAAAAPGPSRTSRPSLNATDLNATEANATAPRVMSDGPSHPSYLSLNTSETTEPSVTTSQAVVSGPSRAFQPRSGRIGRAVRGPHFLGPGSPKLRNISGVLPPPRQECIMNVSARHSEFGEVRGHFDAAQFQNSKIVFLEGMYYGKLVLSDSEVANISLSGETVTIQNTNIESVSDLTVKRRLVLRHVEVQRLARDGLLLYSLGHGVKRQPHLLTHVSVGRMEAKSLVVTGAEVKMTDVSVDVMAKDAIIVRNGGVLNLTHVELRGCKSFQCLTLQRGARLVLRNTTIRNRTITKVELQPTSEADMYPLLALVSTEDHPSLKVTFEWYWVILMGVCGVVAGLVIGSALMWRRRSPRVSPASTFTLADLLSHDQLREGGNVQNHPPDDTTSRLRPSIFTRQDSGLSSSSFGSYANFQTPPSTLLTMTSESNSRD